MGLFGPEKVTLVLEKYNYSPGETIKGTVTLNLKKPTKARKMTVSFVGQTTERYRGSNGRSEHRTIDVFRFDMPLGLEKEYQNESFNFEIKIPDNILQQEKFPGSLDPDSTLGKVAAFGVALSAARRYPIEWLVDARLDIPLKFDVGKSQKIILS